MPPTATAEGRDRRQRLRQRRLPRPALVDRTVGTSPFDSRALESRQASAGVKRPAEVLPASRSRPVPTRRERP